MCVSGVISCRHLQRIAREKNHFYPDGVYKIYPTGSRPVMTYCDMTRDGGGWTLLVTSHTNSWKAQNVKLRNTNYPKLTGDFSILQYADSIKNNKEVTGNTFEYRLEAQSRGNKVFPQQGEGRLKTLNRSCDSKAVVRERRSFVIQDSRFPSLSKFSQAIFPLTSQHDVLEYEIERRTFTRVPNATALEIVATLFLPT